MNPFSSKCTHMFQIRLLYTVDIFTDKNSFSLMVTACSGKIRVSRVNRTVHYNICWAQTRDNQQCYLQFDFSEAQLWPQLQ